MRKFTAPLIILFISILVFSLVVGCGRKAPDDTTTTTATGTTTTTSTSTTTTLSSSAPILLSPLNLARTNHANVFLVWDPPSVETESIVSYEVTFSTTHEFTPSETIITTQGAITSWETGTLLESNYFWTVRAKASDEVWGDQSVSWRFLVDFTSPEAPSLISPIGNEVTKEARPIFSWNAVPDASGIATYEVTIDSVVDGMVIGSLTTYEPVSNLSNGSHTWKVRAKDRASNWGTFSSTETFSIDSTPPSIESCTPTNGATGLARTGITVSVQFNKVMTESSLTNAFRVLNGSGASIEGAVSYNSSTKTLTFTPTHYLDYGATYSASVDATVTDYIGNIMVSPYSFSFTTISPVFASETVDWYGSNGKYSSLAIDSNSKCYISYNALARSTLRCVSGEAGNWTTYEVDTANGVGQYTSIALAVGNQIYISHYDSNLDHIKVATSEIGPGGGLVWTSTSIESGTDLGQFSSLKIQGTTAHLCYYNNTSKLLEYSINNGLGWADSTVENNPSEGRYCSLAVDTKGLPSISFYDDTNTRLKYAKKESGGSPFTVTVVDDTGNAGVYSSLAVDSDNNAHISYNDQTIAPYPLKYATNSSGTWEVFTVTPDQDCRDTAIAVTPSKNVYIAYYNNTEGDLMLASNATGSWTTSTIEAAGSVGTYPSIALDALGRINVSYYERLSSTDGKLKYSHITN